MEILLGFEMEKTGENLEYWAKNFPQMLGHILIRDTDNEIYWVSPPRPGFLGVFFFCPETAVERIEQLWVKLESETQYVSWFMELSATSSLWST